MMRPIIASTYKAKTPSMTHTQIHTRTRKQQVHPDLAKIIRDYSKAVIKAGPSDVIEFSWEYFRKKVEDDMEKEKKEREAEADMLASSDSWNKTAKLLTFIL